LARYPLLDALIERRSRRFGEGMRLNGGPLAYNSTHAPQPLSLEEEAALAFADCGITGFALADLPYESGEMPEAGGGNIMTHFVGRTVASGDAMHYVTLFVINDEGVWMLKRPQDYPREEIAGLSQAARERRLVELYEKSRVQIAKGRHEVPRELPFVAPFNKWSTNLPARPTFCRSPNAPPSTSTSCCRLSARSSATSWWTSATASNLRASLGSPGPGADTCTTILEGAALARSDFSRASCTSLSPSSRMGCCRTWD
jgi:hypothetical protein